MTVDPGGAAANGAASTAAPTPFLSLHARRPLLGPPSALPGGQVVLTMPGEGVSLYDAEGLDLLTLWSGADATLASAAAFDAPTGRLFAVAAENATSSSSLLLSWDAAAPEGSLPALADVVALPGRASHVVSAAGRAFVVFVDGRAVPVAAAAAAVPTPTSTSSKKGGRSSSTVILAVGGGSSGNVAVIMSTPSSKPLKLSLFGPDGSALVEGAALPPPASSTATLAAATLTGSGGAGTASPLMLALAWSDGLLALVPVGPGGLGTPRTRRLPGFTAKPLVASAPASVGGRKRAAAESTPAAASSSPADHMALTEDGSGGVVAAYPTPAGLALLALDGPLAAPRCAPVAVPSPPASRSGTVALHLTRLASDDAPHHQLTLLLSGPGGAALTCLDTPPPGFASLIGSCPPTEGGSGDAAATAAAAAALVRPAWADMGTGTGTPTAATSGLTTQLDAASLGGAAAGPAGPAAAAAKAAAAAAAAVADLEEALEQRGVSASASGTPSASITAAADKFADAAALAPLPADLLGRGAAAGGALGAWPAVKRALASQPLPSLAPAPGLVPAAAAAGEADLAAALLRVADLPPEDAAALVEGCLVGGWEGGGAGAVVKRRTASLTAWRARLEKTAAGAVTDAENAPAGPVRERAALRAAAAVAAVDGSFAASARGSDAAYLLHGLIASPRDDAALAAAAGRLAPSAAPALACYLAAWARALGGGSGAPSASAAAAAAPSLGCPPPPPLVVPTIVDVAAWASALVDAHLVALAGAARQGGEGAAALAAALRDLHALACAEAADAAALAPLAGAAAHIAAAAPLPDMAVAAATVYSVELLDLGAA